MALWNYFPVRGSVSLGRSVPSPPPPSCLSPRPGPGEKEGTMQERWRGPAFLAWGVSGRRETEAEEGQGGDLCVLSL